MLEDFMKREDVSDVDNDRTFKQEVTNLVGTYTSANKDDVISISVKVNRDLYNRYDVLRRLFKRTRREDLERFMRWSIERHKSESKGLETFFTKDEDIKENE